MGKQYILNEVAYAHLTPSGRLHIALPHEENVMFEEKDSDVILTILNILKIPPLLMMCPPLFLILLMK